VSSYHEQTLDENEKDLHGTRRVMGGGGREMELVSVSGFLQDQTNRRGRGVNVKDNSLQRKVYQIVSHLKGTERQESGKNEL